MREILILALLALAAFAEDDELQRRTEKQCARINEVLEQFLGRKFKGPVPVQTMTKDEITEYIRALAKKQTPQGEMELAQRLAERLHLVPKGYDLLENQLKMLEKGIAGLYDPDEDRFYVVKGTGSPGTGPFMITAAHELVHAYRDVDKDYWQRMVTLIHDDADWAQGVRFLVEGDATFLGIAVGLAAMQGQEGAWGIPAAQAQAANPESSMRLARANPHMAEFPLVLREMLIGAYLYGQHFASKVYERGGIKALDAAYDRPPRSTEQALHPEKYLGPEVDEPTVFSGGDPTAALGEGWTLGLVNVMGEFDVRVMFFEALGEQDANAAAAGWDGARYFFCTKDGVPEFVGLVSTWDAEKDAAEFAAAWVTWATKRDGGELESTAKGGDWNVETKEGLVVVRRVGKDVLVADGVPPDRIEPVMKALATAERAERAADADPLHRPLTPRDHTWVIAALAGFTLLVAALAFRGA